MPENRKNGRTGIYVAATLLASLALVLCMPWVIAAREDGGPEEASGFVRMETYTTGSLDAIGMSIWYPEDGPEPPASVRADNKNWTLVETYPAADGLVEAAYRLDKEK